MKKRKILAALLAGMITIPMLVGCQSEGGETVSNEGKPESSSEETVELSFYMSNSAVNDFD